MLMALDEDRWHRVLVKGNAPPMHSSARQLRGRGQERFHPPLTDDLDSRENDGTRPGIRRTHICKGFGIIDAVWDHAPSLQASRSGRSTQNSLRVLLIVSKSEDMHTSRFFGTAPPGEAY